MRSILLCIFLTLASPFSKGSVITFDIVTPDELAFTVEWGPSPLQGGFFTEQGNNTGLTVIVLEEPDDQFGPVNRVTVDPVGAGFPTTEVAFHFPAYPNVSYGDATISVDSTRDGAPTSISPTADGYGARFVYLADDAPAVPDSGSGLALLGIAACVCLGKRLT
jgi:hypothetical protein